MATARAAWGIDIGNRALKAVKVVKEADGVRIADFDVVEHENVLSNAGDNRDALIQNALVNFVQTHNVKGAPVAVGRERAEQLRPLHQAAAGRGQADPRDRPVRGRSSRSPSRWTTWSGLPAVQGRGVARRGGRHLCHAQGAGPAAHQVLHRRRAERPGRADEPAGRVQRHVPRRAAQGHDDDHRPGRREHRPDHRRGRDRLAPLHPDRRATTSPRRWSRASSCGSRRPRN